MATTTTSATAIRALQLEMTKINKDPVEGVVIELQDESNLFEWNVGIFGPPKTLYEGGYFKAKMKFPQDYPYSPPTVCFITKMWHPNIYETGDVCISILHPPVDDPHSGELPQERWNPTQNVSKQVAQSRAEAEAEGITIPKTVEEYCIKHKPIGSQSSETQVDPLEDWYDDDEYGDEDDEEEDSDCFNNEDDSGNED